MSLVWGTMRLVDYVEVALKVGELFLGLVKALAWPGVVLVVFLCLKPQFQALIGKLEKASWRGGELSFNQELTDLANNSRSYADSLVESPNPERSRVEGATREEPAEDNEPPGPAPQEPASERPRHDFRLVSALMELHSGPDFATARGLINESPDATVILAFRELERVARTALTAQHLGQPPVLHGERLIRAVLPEGGVPSRDDILRSLVSLRNEVVHGMSNADLYEGEGLESYIEACENLSDAIFNVTVSKLRHPSRGRAAWEAVQRAGVDPQELDLRPGL